MYSTVYHQKPTRQKQKALLDVSPTFLNLVNFSYFKQKKLQKEQHELPLSIYVYVCIYMLLHIHDELLCTAATMNRNI